VKLLVFFVVGDVVVGVDLVVVNSGIKDFVVVLL